MAEIHIYVMVKIFIFQDEVKEWLFPTSYDFLAAEANHLIYHADGNEVRLINETVLSNGAT